MDSNRGRRTAWGLAALSAVALAAGGGLWFGGRDRAPVDCEGGRAALRVTASPDIAPAVSTVAQRWAAEPRVCVDVTVASGASARVLGQLQNGSVQPPDVWIPDSTLWLTRAKDDQVASTADAPAVATSPLVLAVTAKAATALNATGRPTVGDLVAAATGSGGPAVGIAADRLAPERVGTILALRDATAARADARGAMAALLRGASVGTEASSAVGSADGLAQPMPEQSVWAANPAGVGAPSVVAVYPSQRSYDYPYAVLATTPAVQATAGALLDRLRLPSAQQVLRAAGFRDAGGGPGLDLTAARGVDGAQASAATRLTAASLADAEKTLAAVRLDAKLTAVIDVSGSMDWGIDGKGSPGPSRMQIAQQSAMAGLALYPASTLVELWAFSEKLDGDKPYRLVVPSVALDAGGKQQLAAGITSLKASGGTGLYTTTLAAVRSAQASYAAGRVNAIVVLSDGADSENAMSLAQVVQTLRSEARVDRPVPVITIAFGPDADREAMKALSAATGGAAYRATSPDQIHQVFLDAVGQRACRPDCAA